MTGRLVRPLAIADVAVLLMLVWPLAVAPLCARLLKSKSKDVAFRRAALPALGTVGAADWPAVVVTLGGVPESHRDPETVAVLRETFVRILITVRQGRPAPAAEVETALRGAAAAFRSTS